MSHPCPCERLEVLRGRPKTWEEFRDRALALTLTVLKQAAHVPSESHSRQEYKVRLADRKV